ncbi:MAG: MFS transporter [Cellvibrionaceae bacterium]
MPAVYTVITYLTAAITRLLTLSHSQTNNTLHSGLAFYLTAILLLSIVVGLQIVAIPWLAIDYLSLSPSAVGLVQAAVLLPNVLLIFGGLAVDKGLLVNKFIYLLIAYGLLHGLLLLLLMTDWLSLIWLLFYALLLACVGAFVQPCKDYILGSLSDANLQSVIAKNQCCQYVGQAIGIGLASTLYGFDVNFLPLVQIILTALAIAVFYFFYQSYGSALVKASVMPASELPLASLLMSGIRFCWQSIILRSLLFIVVINGFFHIGVFVVALPVLVKTVYAGSIGLYALLQCLFILGTLTTTIIVIYKGQLDAPGRRVIFSLLYAGLILLGLSAGPTEYGLWFLVFLWGVVVGVSATLGRAILQSQVSAEHRGRAISIYQFSLFGFAPLGSLFAGIAIEYWHVLFVLKVSAIVSFIAFATLFFTKPLWDVEAEDTCSTQ